MKRSIIFILAVLALIAAACGGKPAPAPTQPPAPAATTAPTTAPTEAPTNTPEPTADLAATSDAENAAAMAEWEAYIEPDLVMAGYSLDIGELSWLQTQTFDLINNTPGTYMYQDLDTTFTAANFVMGVDITWDSTTGVAGCGLIFRAQGDLSRSEQARFYTIRLSGFPGWDFELWQFGQYQANLSGSVRTSSAIEQAAGSTNHYVLSVDGTTATAYANGERLGSTDLKASMSEGLFGVTNFEDSGKTTCTYENIWIWGLP